MNGAILSSVCIILYVDYLYEKTYFEAAAHLFAVEALFSKASTFLLLKFSLPSCFLSTFKLLETCFDLQVFCRYPLKFFMYIQGNMKW